MNGGQDSLQATGGLKDEQPYENNFAMFAAQYAALITSHPELASSEIQQLINISQPMEQNKEKERIANRLMGFNPKDNSVWREISTRFGANIKQPELLSIAQVLASSANIKLDRDAKRRKSVLIKWFEENWGQIQPYLDYVVLEDSHQ